MVRALRCLIFGLCLGSIAMVIVVGGLWWRSQYRSDVFVLQQAKGWYWVRSTEGRLIFLRPAAPVSLPVGLSATLLEEWTSDLNNSQIHWTRYPDNIAAADPSGSLVLLSRVGKPAIPYLLRALQDKRKFAVAYAALIEVIEDHFRGPDIPWKSSLTHWYRLQVDVDMSKAAPFPDGWNQGVVALHPEQIPELLEECHWFADEQVGSLRHSTVIAVFGCPPLAYIVFFLRPVLTRRYRLGRGLCLRCGYDLRGSSNCCSECGEKMGRDLRRSY